MTTEAEPTREDAELALMAAAEDDRARGLAGHPCAIALLAVLDDLGWRLVMRSDVLSGQQEHVDGRWVDRTWRQVAEQQAAELSELRGWRTLVADLDRNEHGRHEGDSDVGDPTGVSHGNPRMTTGTVIGYSLGGSWQYVMPPRDDRHRLDAWRRPAERPQGGEQ